MRERVRLVCDGCGTLREARLDVSVDQLREQLARIGWFSDKANDRDGCPTCVESGRLVVARG